MNPDTERESTESEIECDVIDDEDAYRPLFWYNRDYNIPDECRFYDE